PPPSPLFPYTTLFRSQLGSAEVVLALNAGLPAVFGQDPQIRVGLRRALEHQPGSLISSFAAGRIGPIGAQPARYVEIRAAIVHRSEEHTSELQSLAYL